MNLPGLVLLLLLAWGGLRAEAPLLVCLPGGQPPARIDSALGPSLSPSKVIAFVRVRDLEEVMPAYPTASIMTTSAYAAYLDGYSIRLKGKRSDAQSRYLVVSADSAVTAASLASRRIGILDFLGRDKISRFVEDLFGVKPAALKRVSKREDLLSLIGMEAVDAVIVADGDLGELQRETKLRLSVVMESKPVYQFPVLAVPAGGDDRARQILLRQPKSVLAILGVERWE